MFGKEKHVRVSTANTRIKRVKNQRNWSLIGNIILVIVILCLLMVGLQMAITYNRYYEGNINGGTTLYTYNDIIYDDAIYVHKDGDNSTGDNWEEAYININGAIFETSADLDDKTIIFVGIGLFDVNVAGQLNITKNVHIVGSGRDATIFTNTHNLSNYVFNVTQYFKSEYCAILCNSNLNGINVYGNYSDTHLIHMKFIDDIDIGGYYSATYSFDDGLDGWTVDDAAGIIEVIAELDGHFTVTEMYDEDGVDFLELMQTFTDGGQESGTIEWWWRTDFATEESLFQPSNGLTNVFIFGFRGDDFDYYDGGWNEILSPALANRWYHIRVDFECSTSGYMDLAQFTYMVYINGVEYGAFPFWNNELQINNIYFASDVTGMQYSQFIDAVDYSWEYPIALHLEYSGYGEYKDLHFDEMNNFVAINVSNSFHNHFWDIEIYECAIGIYIGSESQDNLFNNFHIHGTDIGIDIDAGENQHFKDIIIYNCTINVDDEIGNSFWCNIATDIMEAIVSPNDLVGVDVDTDIVASTYGLDVMIYDASASDRPYYIVAVAFEPDVKERYGLRLTDDGGISYFYETVIEANFIDQIDRFIIELPRIFNAHSQIHCSIMSETGRDDMDIWLEIILI